MELGSTSEIPIEPHQLAPVTLLGFLSLWRMLVAKAHLPWVYLTQYVPLSGFVTSQRFPSSATYRPCFMPDPPMGFPLQSFLPLKQGRHLSMSSAFLVLRTQVQLSSSFFQLPGKKATTRGNLSQITSLLVKPYKRGQTTFKALIRLRMRTHKRRVKPHASRSSPGFFLSKAFPPPDYANTFTHLHPLLPFEASHC